MQIFVHHVSLVDHILRDHPRRVSTTAGHESRNSAVTLVRSASVATYNVKPRTHHGQRFVDILFNDGHVVSRRNQDARFTVDVRDYGEIRDAFSKILGVLEQADAAF